MAIAYLAYIQFVSTPDAMVSILLLHTFIARSSFRNLLFVISPRDIGTKRGHKYQHPPGPLPTLPDFNNMSFEVSLLPSRPDNR
jgi:hypothetical protein